MCGSVCGSGCVGVSGLVWFHGCTACNNCYLTNLLLNVFFHSLNHIRQVKVYSLENYSVLHHLTYAAPVTCVAMSVSAGRMHTCRISLCACEHGNHHF